MARIRTIKPEFWESEDTSSLSPMAALTYIGLWNYADDAGNGKAGLSFIHTRLHWNRPTVTLEATKAAIDELTSKKLVVLYAGEDGHPYYSIPAFKNHQIIDRKSKFRNPAPPSHGAITEDSASPQRGLGVGREGKGREREGERTEPPPLSEPKTDEPSNTARFLAKTWNDGPGVHLGGNKAAEQIQAAIDVGVQADVIDQAFLDHERIRGLKIWEVLDPLRPSRKDGDFKKRREANGPAKL